MGITVLYLTISRHQLSI